MATFVHVQRKSRALATGEYHPFVKPACVLVARNESGELSADEVPLTLSGAKKISNSLAWQLVTYQAPPPAAI